MTLGELLEREKCTDEEIRQVQAYYLALKIEPILVVAWMLFQTSSLFPKDKININK